jgi:hypothetical protein
MHVTRPMLRMSIERGGSRGSHPWIHAHHLLAGSSWVDASENEGGGAIFGIRRRVPLRRSSLAGIAEGSIHAHGAGTPPCYGGYCATISWVCGGLSVAFRGRIQSQLSWEEHYSLTTLSRGHGGLIGRLGDWGFGTGLFPFYRGIWC